MTIELKYLTWVTLLTAVTWMPYIINMILVRGLGNAVGYPDSPKPLSSWAARMKNAHANAAENLVIFATLVLVAHAAGVSSEATVLASVVYFWARVVHLLSYTSRTPWIRTLAFVVGFGCQVVIAGQILAQA